MTDEPMLKVLWEDAGQLVSPFQGYPYEVGKRYECPDFDADPSHECSRGFYATRVDGLPYSWRDLPGYHVYEVEVGGMRVEIDQFKRRYERLRLVREVPRDELQALALAAEESVGYRLAEALFPVNPLMVERGPVTPEDLDLLRQWVLVQDSVWDSVGDSVWDSVGASVRDSVGASVRDSVWASVGAYVSSLFPNIKKWKGIDHPEGANPFQPGIDLWKAGLVPSFDGKCWRLHAGPAAEVVWGPHEVQLAEMSTSLGATGRS